ncbi:MAG TPA: hypothetical protein VEX37_06245, partial [Thermomicrobiales bacterium]|nr:hypothetical protein [Thermomicrobiales bacterium]
MKRIVTSLVLVGLLCMSMVVSIASAATETEVVFDTIPNPLPGNIISQGFQATSTDEIGDHISVTGEARTLTSVTVTMSAWAKKSEYPDLTNPAGWDHPITLNLYQVDNSGEDPALGALFSSTTQTFLIPWRPEPDPTCPGGTAWRASNGTCFNGLAFNIVFNIANVELPDEFIYGVAYNTHTHGAVPIGTVGPWSSLNVGLTDSAPSVGTNVEPDAVFIDTVSAFYTDNGAGGTDTFRRDTAWAGRSPTVQFTVTYELPTPDDMFDTLRSDTIAFVD